MAPYRVSLFSELGRYCDLTVCFEQQADDSREKDWFINKVTNFHFIALQGWERPVSRIKFDVWRHVKKSKYDLAIAYEYSTLTGMLFILLCKLRNIPYLINCDGAFIDKKSVKDVIKRFFIRGAVACLANGEHARSYFQNFGAEPENIHNHHFTSLYERDIAASPVKASEKAELRNEIGLAGFDKIVITVGRLIKSKRIDVAITAWSAMPANWLLVVVGTGELDAALRNQAKELGLGNVRFTGHLNAESLKKMYRASDLFVLPTESDVWGLVVNEALAVGLPVITTDKCIAGLELIVNGYNGHILTVGDPEQLAKVLRESLSDVAGLQKMSLNAIGAIKDYTYENVAASHLAVFGQLVQMQ